MARRSLSLHITVHSSGRAAVLLGLLFGLAGTSSSAVTVALPELAGELRITPATAAWIISGYTVALAVATPTHGRLADMLGIRLPLVVGVSAMSLGALDMEFYSSMLFGAVLTGATLLSTTGSLALTWFARKTTLEGEVSPVSPREAGLTSPVAEAPASPAADFAIGAVLLVIGLGVTAVSMSAASGGGRYVVATGAIGVGLGRVIRGFIKLGRGA